MQLEIRVNEIGNKNSTSQAHMISKIAMPVASVVLSSSSQGRNVFFSAFSHGETKRCSGLDLVVPVSPLHLST